MTRDDKWKGLSTEIMRSIVNRVGHPVVSSRDASEALSSLVEVTTFIINLWSESEDDLKTKIRNLVEIMEETAIKRRRNIENMQAMEKH